MKLILCIRKCILFVACSCAIVGPALVAQTSSSSKNAASADKDAVLPEVVVAGSREKQVNTNSTDGTAAAGYKTDTNQVGPLGNLPVIDTPYSIHSTPGELIENRDVHSEFDALQTNPTVSDLMSSSGYSSMSRIMVRGFSAANAGTLRDGLVDRSFTLEPVEIVERVDVLNGPSSFLYGFVDVGGTVNYISKKPTEKPFYSTSYGVYGGAINFLHLDLGGPVPATSQRLLTRINAYRESGDTFVHNGTEWRNLFSQASILKLGAKTELKSNTYFQDLSNKGLTTYFNPTKGNWAGTGILVPSAKLFDATMQYGQDYSFNRTRKTVVDLAFDTQLLKCINMKSAYRYGKMWRDYAFVDAVLTDNIGNYTEKYDAAHRQNETTHADYLLFDVAANTGPIHHDLTFGMTNYYYRYTRGKDLWTVLGSSNIAAPTTFANPDTILTGITTLYNVPNRNILLGDKIHAGDHILATLGINYSSIKDQEWTTASGKFYSGQHAYTPTLTLAYKPTNYLSIYSSYIQALQEGGQAPDGVVNANQILPPSKSDQYEVGAKADLAKTQITLALYRISEVNEYTDPRDNVYKQDGREVHKGVELTDTGKITDRLTVTGGFALLRARVEQERADPTLEGTLPLNIPERQFRAYVEYRMPHLESLTPIFNVNYSGRRSVDSYDTQFMPGSTIYDAGLRYETRFLGHKLSVNVNARNLGNTHYWSYYRSSDGLQIGEPRTVSFTLKGQW